MPEEFNRILTDSIADYLFVTEQSGHDHLVKEGRKEEEIFFSGNTMIDTLVAFDEKIQQSLVLDLYGLKPKDFVLMTMHRPATVDFQDGLGKLISIIELITSTHTLIFPVHPRTLQRMAQFGLLQRFNKIKNLVTTEPLDYFSFQKLISDCLYVITDSGGIQEETTFRKVPCLTLRGNTERPSTVTIGTNELIPFDVDAVSRKINSIINGTYKKGEVPPLWDGEATGRILQVLKSV
jgi:UDP-N-acetylglucosamine 2-epimerase (non-hydrolysing)